MRETRIVEFKETITNTFLKTVSAFSNYDGGTILFGVDDDGNIKGLPDVKQACLDIENKINDSITPQPDYTLEIQNNDQTIKLTVKSGLQKPYLYKSKAYKRNDTATIEVDTLEFSRLVLDGKNIRFEELPCKDQELSFEILHRKLKETVRIENFDKDTLKTLNIERFSLYRPELWYTEMEEDKYEFPETVHIPAGSCVELLNIDFNLQDIDMLEKWVLPLTIVDDGSYAYQSHPRKNYAKALLKVVPFNNYSGSYTASSMKVYTYINGKPDTNARTTDKRTGYVVDNNSIFFYAGLINEDMDKDMRKKYKINVHFKEDGTLDMKQDDPSNEMEFELIGTPTYSSTSVMDATRPYLERRYVQIMFEYDFQDFTYGGSGTEVIPIKYRVAGSMTLLRNINTQIPDEDQQIQWD